MLVGRVIGGSSRRSKNGHARIRYLKTLEPTQDFQKHAKKAFGPYEQSYGKDGAKVLKMATDLTPETKAWLKNWIKQRFNVDI